MERLDCGYRPSLPCQRPVPGVTPPGTGPQRTSSNSVTAWARASVVVA